VQDPWHKVHDAVAAFACLVSYGMLKECLSNALPSALLPQVTDRPNAATVLGMVYKSLTRFTGLNEQQLQQGVVGLGTDGANVMTGVQSRMQGQEAMIE